MTKQNWQTNVLWSASHTFSVSITLNTSCNILETFFSLFLYRLFRWFKNDKLNNKSRACGSSSNTFARRHLHPDHFPGRFNIRKLSIQAILPALGSQGSVGRQTLKRFDNPSSVAEVFSWFFIYLFLSQPISETKICLLKFFLHCTAIGYFLHWQMLLSFIFLFFIFINCSSTNCMYKSFCFSLYYPNEYINVILFSRLD